MNGSPRKTKPSKALTIQADTEAPVQPDGMLDVDRDMSAPRRLGSVRFAQHLQPDSPTTSSVIGESLLCLQGISAVSTGSMSCSHATLSCSCTLLLVPLYVSTSLNLQKWGEGGASTMSVW